MIHLFKVPYLQKPIQIKTYYRGSRIYTRLQSLTTAPTSLLRTYLYFLHRLTSLIISSVISTYCIPFHSTQVPLSRNYKRDERELLSKPFLCLHIVHIHF